MIFRIFTVNTDALKITRSGVTKIAHTPDRLAKFRILRNHRPAFHRMIQLGGMKTGRADIPVMISRLAFILRAKTVGRVVNHFQPIFISYLSNSLDITRVAEYVGSQYARRLVGNGLLN